MKYTLPTKYEIHFSVKYTFTHQLQICTKYISVDDQNLGVLVGYQTRPQTLLSAWQNSERGASLKQNRDFAAFLPRDPPSQYWARAATKTGWPDNYHWRDNIIFKNFYLFARRYDFYKTSSFFIYLPDNYHDGSNYVMQRMQILAQHGNGVKIISFLLSLSRL